jgi:hypothetical protein
MCKRFWDSTKGGATGFEMNYVCPTGCDSRQNTVRKGMNPLWDVED